MATDPTYRTDDITLAMLSEREARVALADAFDRLADCTRDFVRCVVSRDDLYVNRGRSWASPKAEVCVFRSPSLNAPSYHSHRVGFRVFLRVREGRAPRE